MISNKPLDIICCPETKQNLNFADDTVINKLNKLIESGQLLDRSEKSVEEKIDGGLIREDKKYLYPIRNEIPILLIEEAIPLENIS